MRMYSSIWERIVIETSKGCMKNGCVRKEKEVCVQERGWGCMWTHLPNSEGFKTVTYKHLPAG